VNKMVAASVENSTREAFGAILTAWGHADFASEVPSEDQVPVSVLVGEHDPALSEEFVKGSWLKTYPDATVQVIPNAGHYPMFEAPVNFTTLVEKALD
jgi:pimeloyl-ACP methyl ester carboxylesterase